VYARGSSRVPPTGDIVGAYELLAPLAEALAAKIKTARDGWRAKGNSDPILIIEN
jgi:hypothetical protein